MKCSYRSEKSLLDFADGYFYYFMSLLDQLHPANTDLAQKYIV